MGSVSEQLSAKTITVEEAVSSGGLPERVLHMFSCDCAQRAMLREEALGLKIDPRSWKAIETKRLWLEERVSDLEFMAVWVNAWANAADSWGVGTVHHHAINLDDLKNARVFEAAAYAVTRRADDALEVVIRTQPDDEEWQRKRLIWLLEIHAWAGDRMTFLIPEGRIEEPEGLKTHENLPLTSLREAG